MIFPRKNEELSKEKERSRILFVLRERVKLLFVGG